MSDINQAIKEHRQSLLACNRCPNMVGPVVSGQPVMSPILLIGQAPGDKEGIYGKPFAWTAGKTMFKWFEQIGIAETNFRQRVYMAAVCRCFPGKNPKGGDRVPDKTEIQQCSNWLQAEVALLKPELIVPVGKIAIAQMLNFKKLTEVIGQKHQGSFHGHQTDIIPLPHPSGASTWHRMEPGISLLQAALQEIAKHQSWQQIL